LQPVIDLAAAFCARCPALRHKLLAAIVPPQGRSLELSGVVALVDVAAVGPLARSPATALEFLSNEPGASNVETQFECLRRELAGVVARESVELREAGGGRGPADPPELAGAALEDFAAAATELRADAAHTAEALTARLDDVQTATAALQTDLKSVMRSIAFFQSSFRPTDHRGPCPAPVHRYCRNIFGEYAGYCAVASAPRYELDRLREVLMGDRDVVWWSDCRTRGRPSITIEFTSGVIVSLASYSLMSGHGQRGRQPNLKSWDLYGCVAGEWRLLDRHEATETLADGLSHEFMIPYSGSCVIDAVRLCLTGRNGCGSNQMHLRKFSLHGLVISPESFIAGKVIPGVLDEPAWCMDREAELDRISRHDVVAPLQTEQPFPSGAGIGEFSSLNVPEKRPEAIEIADSSVGSALPIERRVPGNEESGPGMGSGSTKDRQEHQSTPVSGVVLALSQRDTHSSDSATHKEERAGVASMGTDSSFKDAQSVMPSDLAPRWASPPLSSISDAVNEKLTVFPALPSLPPEQRHNPSEDANRGEENLHEPSRHDDRQSRASEVPATITGRNLVCVNENFLLPNAVRAEGPNIPSITDLAGIEEVRTLSLSRFGSVRLMRRPIEGGFEYFAAKHYNRGDNRDGLQAFQNRIRGFVSLSHPSIMRIVGVIPPTQTAGPIILTPYSEFGSLSDVLKRVRRNDPPPIWSEAGKLRMMISLISGFQYLHSQGIVHREVKPSDLIVESDGSIRICGYLTSVLEEHKWTRASEVGLPSYMAPEVYEDRENERKSRDPKTDVFSFGLILYELMCGQPVFSSKCSAAVIMRRAMSAKAGDRPVIPGDLSPILRELIVKSWISAAAKRQSFEAMWNRLRDIRFAVFSAVAVEFVPLSGTDPPR
jgi:hypothetical protein